VVFLKPSKVLRGAQQKTRNMWNSL